MRFKQHINLLMESWELMVFSFLQRKCYPPTSCIKKIADQPCYNAIFYLKEHNTNIRKSYALCLPAIDLQKMPIWQKKIIFSDEAYFGLGGYVNTKNCRIWSTENRHSYIERPTHPKRVTVWAIFLRKWTRRGRYSQWRSLSGHVEWIFVHRNWRGGYWQDLVSTGRRYMPYSRSYTRCFAPCFWRLHYQPQSWCRLSTSELRFDTVGLLIVGCRQR